jgi:hypothetical protein
MSLRSATVGLRVVGDAAHTCEGGTIRKLQARAIRRFVARPLIAHVAITLRTRMLNPLKS